MSFKKLIHKYTWYGFIGFFRLLRDIFLSKLLFSNVRIIRYPFYIRGKKQISFGKNFTCGVNLRLDIICSNKNKILIIGNNVQLNDYVHIGAVNKILIEDNVLIASKVFISDHNHGNYNGILDHSNPNEPPSKRELSSSPVIIEKNVWIGESVCILPGVKIGEGSIIGANSVVSRDIPKFSIAAGNPARVIKYFNFNTGFWEKK